jgi:hypothetical protein
MKKKIFTSTGNGCSIDSKIEDEAIRHILATPFHVPKYIGHLDHLQNQHNQHLGRYVFYDDDDDDDDNHHHIDMQCVSIDFDEDDNDTTLSSSSFVHSNRSSSPSSSIISAESSSSLSSLPCQFELSPIFVDTITQSLSIQIPEEIMTAISAITTKLTSKSDIVTGICEPRGISDMNCDDDWIEAKTKSSLTTKAPIKLNGDDIMAKIFKKNVRFGSVAVREYSVTVGAAPWMGSTETKTTMMISQETITDAIVSGASDIPINSTLYQDEEKYGEVEKEKDEDDDDDDDCDLFMDRVVTCPIVLDWDYYKFTNDDDEDDDDEDDNIFSSIDQYEAYMLRKKRRRSVLLRVRQQQIGNDSSDSSNSSNTDDEDDDLLPVRRLSIDERRKRIALVRGISLQQVKELEFDRIKEQQQVHQTQQQQQHQPMLLYSIQQQQQSQQQKLSQNCSSISPSLQVARHKPKLVVSTPAA